MDCPRRVDRLLKASRLVDPPRMRIRVNEGSNEERVLESLRLLSSDGDSIPEMWNDRTHDFGMNQGFLFDNYSETL